MTIDYGGHPNERALSSILKLEKDQKGIRFNFNCLTDDLTFIKGGLKSTALIGICSLDIFRKVYKERFDLLGITEKLQELKKGL
jgi:hypothetical protein